jgi:YD repeat-containing protein
LLATPLYRLVRAEYEGDFNGEYRYAYDAVGNRTAYTTTITSTTVITYRYDAANRLLESREAGGEVTVYEWDDAGRLVHTAVDSTHGRTYTYDQRGNLTSALVNNVLTTFVYDGDGRRLQMSIAGEVVTYTLDYAGGGRVLLEEGGAFAKTKHYLYGLECIGELVNADDPENEEWRTYHQDGNHLVRQTTNIQAAVTLAWTYSPEGAIVIGEEGPVTHLGCEGNATYDFSTGLIFKNGRYFDPNTGIWITMGGMVVWNGWQSRPGNGRQRKRSKKWLLLLLLFLIVLVLAGCTPTPTPMPTTTPCPTPTMPGLPSNTPAAPTNTPWPTVRPPNTPTPWPTITPSPTHSPTPTQVLNQTPTPIGTQYPQGLTGFKLSNPFGTERFLRVDRFLSPYGNSRPGGNGHYGVDLVTERYARASHEGSGGSRGKYEEFVNNLSLEPQCVNRATDSR